MSFINQYKDKLFNSEWKFNQLNTLFGWIVFFISLLTYYLTLEPTTSFWDCGEYIATAYKIQVGHPPGAPLFIILGNFFSNLGFGTENVAFMINLMSAICSALTILFLFWSITLLMKKNFQNSLNEIRSKYFIILSAIIGSLVYAFSDSFWFSAVEGEVYAMSSLFTALVFWCILKWEDDFSSPRASKWLVLISFLIGLSIGVHMLNLLAIPAITIIYCYKKDWLWSGLVKEKKNQHEIIPLFFISLLRFIIFNLFGILILALVYYFLIPQIVNLSGKIEIYFINSLNLPLNSGTIFFFLFLASIIIGLLIVSQKQTWVKLNTLILSLLFLLIGYSLFFVLVIRSNANTPIDENNPEDAVSLLAYLNREQYGSKPLFWGEYFNTDSLLVENILGEKTSQVKSNDGKPVYTRGFLVIKGMDTIAECFSEGCIKPYIDSLDSNSDITITEKYLISDSRKNLNIVHEKKNGKKYFCQCGLIEGIKYKGEKNVSIIDKSLLVQNNYIINSGNDFSPQQSCVRCNTNIRKLEEVDQEIQVKKNRPLITTGFFPRMWSSQRGGQHVDPSWVNPRDNRPGYLKWASIPNCSECINIDNRIERDECEDKCYDRKNPRAITFSENLKFFKEYQLNHMYWRYFFWNFSGRQNDIQGHGGIIDGNWITGIKWVDNNVLKLGPQNNMPEHIKNQKGRNTYFLLPFILGFIGFFYHLFKKKRDFWAVFLLFFFTGIAIVIELNQTPLQPRERDYAFVGSFYAFSIWVAFGALAILDLLKFVKQKIDSLINESKLKNLVFQKGVLAFFTFILLGIPTLMAIENWDDHDRSNRYTARDFAKNYLNSCEKDAILFNMGDNDTFPLWYVQEVEGERTDIRTVNLSLLNTDWYINQMRKDAYDGKGVPFSMDPHLYRQGGGGRDVAYKMSIPSEEYFASKEDHEKAIQISMLNGNEKWTLSDFNDWISSEEAYTKIQYPIGCKEDCSELKYFPNDKIIIPVDKGVFEKKIEILKNNIDTILIKREIQNNIDSLEILKNEKFEIKDEYLRKKEKELNSNRLKLQEAYEILSDSVKEENYNQIIKIKESELTLIEDKIIISINAGNLSKNNLMILDMLEQNNWERPIYFATTIGNPSSNNPDFLFLHEYLQLDGLVYKLTPIKNQTNQNGVFSPRIKSDVLYENIMSFDWGGLDSKYDIYLDETNLRMIRNLKNIFTQLSTKLIEENDYKKAKKVIEESLLRIPPEKVPLQDYDCTKYSNKEGSLIENYFKIISQEKVDSIKNQDFQKIINYTNEILNRYSSEIKYYSSFSNEKLSNNLDLQSLLFTASNTVNQILKMRVEYNVPKEIVRKIDSTGIIESIEKMESLASDGILIEALPLIIDNYYYNHNYEKSSQSDDKLSKWIDNKQVPNIVKEELLQIAFTHNHDRKYELLDSVFEANFKILKGQIEQLKKEPLNLENINLVYEKIQGFFEMNTEGGLCYTLTEDIYNTYSSPEHTLMKIKFERFYNDMVNWFEAKQTEIMQSLPEISNDSECACLMQLHNNVTGIAQSEIEDMCIIELQNLALPIQEAMYSGNVTPELQNKFDNLYTECPTYLETFLYVIEQDMTAQ